MMSVSQDGPNPLRPYYKPPPIGIPSDSGPSAGAAAAAAATAAAGASRNISGGNGKSASYASSARDLFSDIDYSDYLAESSPTTIDMVRDMLDQAMYKYTSVLLAQPFENAKTILQVRSAAVGARKVLPPATTAAEDWQDEDSYHRSSTIGGYLSDESDPDEPAYFTSSTSSSQPYHVPSSRPRNSRQASTSGRRSASGNAPSPSDSDANSLLPAHQLVLRRPDSLLEVLSQLWAKEAAWGVWKATNATFIYGVLLRTLESWSRSLFAALLNVPDPGALAAGGAGELGFPASAAASVGADMVDAPWASLGIAVAAAATVGLLLAPLDIIRTKLILTPTSAPRRSLLHNLRALPSSSSSSSSLSSYLCPAQLVLPTLLHSAISPALGRATPLLLRARLGVDPVRAPTAFAAAIFAAAAAELLVKLPVETVLRRAQLAVLLTSAAAAAEPEAEEAAGEEAAAGRRAAGEDEHGRRHQRLHRQHQRRQMETIVDVGPYSGVAGTMWSIVYEEGESPSPSTTTTAAAAAAPSTARKGSRARKGQGLEGLWRGWRVGMWGLVGLWSAGALGGMGGGEF